MATFQEALSAAAKASFCTLTAPVERTLALGEDWYNNAELPGFPSGPTPLGEGLRAARNALCNEVPDSVDGEFEEPFTGGQCPGTMYRVTGQFFVDGSSAGPPFEETMVGPVQYVRGQRADGGCRLELVDGNGDVQRVSGSPPGTNCSYNDLMADPLNGGPNDCGNPPEIPPEQYLPPNFTDDPDVTYTPDSGPNITVPVNLVFAPVKVEVDGRITVPTQVTFNTGVTVDANLDLSTGDFTIIQDIDLTLPTPTTDPTILPDPGGTSGDPPTEGEESERSIIGVYTRVRERTAAFRGQLIEPNAATSLLWGPRLGVVSFHCELLSAPGLGWTQDIDIKYESQITYCPIPWGAKAVAVSPYIGVEFDITLIRAESERALLLQAAESAVEVAV